MTARSTIQKKNQGHVVMLARSRRTSVTRSTSRTSGIFFLLVRRVAPVAPAGDVQQTGSVLGEESTVCVLTGRDVLYLERTRWVMRWVPSACDHVRGLGSEKKRPKTTDRDILDRSQPMSLLF